MSDQLVSAWQSKQYLTSMKLTLRILLGPPGAAFRRGWVGGGRSCGKIVGRVSARRVGPPVCQRATRAAQGGGAIFSSLCGTDARFWPVRPFPLFVVRRPHQSAFATKPGVTVFEGQPNTAEIRRGRAQQMRAPPRRLASAPVPLASYGLGGGRWRFLIAQPLGDLVRAWMFVAYSDACPFPRPLAG